MTQADTHGNPMMKPTAATSRAPCTGDTPAGTWLTCEENTSLPTATLTTYQKRHGSPHGHRLPDLEDTGDSLLYRYVPYQRGVMLAGGKLQALKLRDFASSVNTGKGFLDQPNRRLFVEWVDIPNPDPLDNVFANSTRAQGQAQGAAKFVRGEGAWYGDGLIYFCCTSADGPDIAILQSDEWPARQLTRRDYHSMLRRGRMVACNACSSHWVCSWSSRVSPGRGFRG